MDMVIAATRGQVAVRFMILSAVVVSRGRTKTRTSGSKPTNLWNQTFSRFQGKILQRQLTIDAMLSML